MSGAKRLITTTKPRENARRKTDLNKCNSIKHWLKLAARQFSKQNTQKQKACGNQEDRNGILKLGVVWIRTKLNRQS